MRPHAVRCSQVLSYALICTQMLAGGIESYEVPANPSRSSGMSWHGMLFAFVGAWPRCLHNVAPIRPLPIRARPKAFGMQILPDPCECPLMRSYAFINIHVRSHAVRCSVVPNRSWRARKHFACKSSQMLSNRPIWSQILPYALICSQMLLYTFIVMCFHTLSGALICSRMLSDAPRCSRRLSNAVIRSRMLSYALRCLQILPDALRCVHILPYALRCSQMLSDALICPQMVSDAPIYFQMLSYGLRCSQMLSNVPSCGCYIQ